MKNSIIKSLNSSKIIQNANESNLNSETYDNYINKYMEENFEEKTETELKKIYRDGEELLDYYYIQQTDNSNMSKELINKISYILGNITYHLNDKLYNDLKDKTQKTLEQLRKEKNEIKGIKKQFLTIKKESDIIKKEQKALVTTIIVIVLTISIIPTAIMGISNINPNYIIPFVASVLFVGVIMMTFIYLMFVENIKSNIWKGICAFIIVLIVVWGFAITIDISDKKVANIMTNDSLMYENNNHNNNIVK